MRKLENTLIRNFCFFSIIIVFLFGVISLIVNTFNDSVVMKMIESQYIVNCEGNDDYSDIDITALNKIGGWFEVLDRDYNQQYPDNGGFQYTTNDIVSIVNGEYLIDGKNYRGVIKQFHNNKGIEQIQIIFFPAEILDMTPTLNIPTQISALRFISIYIFAFFIFTAGYFITVFVLSKKVKLSLSKPMNELRIAMKDLGNGDYKKRLSLKAEYEFVEMGNSFNCMAQAMENAVKKREEEEHLRRQLISDISHDIRTPLTVIQGYLLTLMNMDRLDEGRAYLKQCYDTSLEMEDLLEHLRDYNRMLRVDYKLNIEETELTEFIKNILADQYHQIQLMGMNLVVDLDEEERMVKIDKNEMRRAVVNLLNNAIQHNYAQTDVLVSIVDTLDDYFIIIADTGIQFSENFVSCMYEPFAKEEQSRNDNGHSGLGLAIVKKIIDAHGSEIQFEQPYRNYTKAFLIRIKAIF